MCTTVSLYQNQLYDFFGDQFVKFLSCCFGFHFDTMLPPTYIADINQSKDYKKYHKITKIAQLTSKSYKL